MKRITRIFAMLFTACLLFGAVALFAHADGEQAPSFSDLGRANDHESAKEGSTPSYSKNGARAADASSTKVVSAYGNRYMRYAYVEDYFNNTNKNYRRDFLIGNHYDNNKASNSGPKLEAGTLKGLSSYSYFTVDFDICADQYRYLLDEQVDSGEVDENGDPIMTTVTTEHLSPTYPTEPGAYGIRLAYSENSYMSLDMRPVFKFSETITDSETEESVTKDVYYSAGEKRLNGDSIPSSYASLKVYIRYDEANGVWKVYKSSTYTSSSYYLGTLSNELGEWNHFTYVVEVNKNKIANSVDRLYFNGELVNSSTVWTGTSSKYINAMIDILPRAIDWQVMNINSVETPNECKYSMGIDNWNPRYYDAGYTSGDAIGIDDLFGENPVSLVRCEDVVYNVDYVIPAPNKYVEIAGKKVYVHAAIGYAMENLENGATITIPFDVSNVTPPAWSSITIKCSADTKATLSAEAIANGATITKTATGYAVAAGIKANMSLFSDMRFNLYLPKIDGVSITGVDGAVLSEGTVDIGGVDMYVVSAAQSATSFDAIDVTVSYTQGGKARQYKAKLDSLDYATRVAMGYDCGSEEATLIYEMISYKEAIGRLADPDFAVSEALADFKELYDAHADCNCTATGINISARESAVDYSALAKKGVLGIGYKLSLNEVGMMIRVREGTVIDSVSYLNAGGGIKTHTVENGNLIKRDGYYVISGVSAAYIDEIMTITVDGTKGTYSLGKYIENNPDVEVAKNLYKYSIAAENFKTVTIDEMTRSVEQIGKIDAAEESYYVKGYFVGISDEGSGYQKEILLKDTESNALIAVRGIPYGEFPNHGYEKGDLVRLHVTIVDATSQNKRYLTVTENNPEDINDTILSRGNRVSYDLDDAVLIDSWEDMRSFFNVETIEAYTYVHFKGTMWMNTYKSAGDGVLLYRPHFNSKAGGLAAIKPDGKRAVGLRENMLDYNTGVAWSDYFGKYVGSTSYPGIEMEVDFYAVYTAANDYNFQITVIEPYWLTGNEEKIVIEDNKDIVTEVAYSYFRKGNKIHYDQNLRNVDPSPEEATSQHMLYLDCSSYVNAVYQEAFGVNVLDVPRTEMSPNTNNYTIYAKENLGTLPDVIGYWENRDYATEEARAELLASINASLEVGDVIVYRRGSSVEKQSGGHTLIYVGDGLFLHSIGNQYIYNDSEPANSTDYASSAEVSVGTVQIAEAQSLFQPSGGRYLFASNVVTISLLRPLNRNLTPTEKTLKRCALAGVEFEKTVSTGISGAAAIGDTITYNLRIQNRASNVYKDVVFEELLADGVEFVSGSAGLTLDGNKLTMTFDINGREGFDIFWTVKVSDSLKAGDKIKNSTFVGGMDIYNELVVTVSGYTDAELVKIADAANELLKSGASFNDPIDFAKAVYKNALGRELFDYESVSAIMEELYSTKYLNEESALVSMIVPNMFGGKNVSGRNLSDERVRRMYEENLEVGDIIVCSWSTNARVFIYVGNGRLVTVDSLTNSCAAIENGNEEFVKEGSAFYLKSVLGTIVAYPQFVVLRPSMNAN